MQSIRSRLELATNAHEYFFLQDPREFSDEPDKPAVIRYYMQIFQTYKELKQVCDKYQIHHECKVIEDYLNFIITHTANENVHLDKLLWAPFEKTNKKDRHIELASILRWTLKEKFNVSISDKTMDLCNIDIDDKCFFKNLPSALDVWCQTISEQKLEKYRSQSILILYEKSNQQVRNLSKLLCEQLFLSDNNFNEKQKNIRSIISEIFTIIHLCYNEKSAHRQLSELLNQLKKAVDDNSDADKITLWLIDSLKNYLQYYNIVIATEARNANILPDLENFFSTYKIDVHDTDVIEETLLLAADITSLPKKSLLKLPDIKKNPFIQFSYIELPKADAEKLNEYLEKYDSLASVEERVAYQSSDTFSKTRYHIHKKEQPYNNTPLPTYVVTMSADKYCEVILGIIKEQFLKRIEQKDPKIDEYRQQSKQHFHDKTPSTSFDPTLFATSKVTITQELHEDDQNQAIANAKDLLSLTS